LALALPFLLILTRDLAEVAARWSEVAPGFGVDYRLYTAATTRWMAGGGFYEPLQVAGPYVPWGLPSILYPPTTLLLFVPFTILPAVLWWAIPIGIVAAVMVGHRPHPLAWPAIAMCLWFPTTAEVIYAGNPVLWIVAALAIATRWPAAAVLVLLKPTLAPFALWGIRCRSWWLALACLAAVSLVFLPMWVDYIHVLLNARDPNGLLYSLNQVPTLLVPVVAWLGRR
jgi:hypothetical protein